MAENWGGTRKGAGRKKEANPIKSVVVRVDESLLPIINELKERHKSGQGIESLLPVTNNQDIDLQAKVKELEKLVDHQNQLIHELNDKPLAKKKDELIISNNDCIVTYGKLRAEFEQFKKTNLDLVLQKDSATLKAVKLQGKVNSLKSDIKKLETSANVMHDKEHNCMALKKDHSRCTRPARTMINWHGVEIRVCLQHSKIN